MLYEFIKLIKNIQEYIHRGKSQIYRGKICSSGVIINPLREQAAVYVAFYMYKIVRITEEWKAEGGREGGRRRLRQRWYNARKFAKGEEV